MKRKIYALLLVAVLAVAMIKAPVMAAVSPTAAPAPEPAPAPAAPAPVVDAVAPASAVSVNVAGSAVSVLEGIKKAEIADVAEDVELLKYLRVSTSAKLASSFDLKYAGTIPAGGVQIPITVNAGNVGDYAYILHQPAPGKWEKVGEGVLNANRTVVGTFKSFSPVAVMVVDAASVSSNAKAPKTGN